MTVPCQNPPTHILQGIDAQENDLPHMFACHEHVVPVLRWFIVDNNVHGAWIEPFEEDEPEVETAKCSYVTDEEMKSILESKRRITEELERRIAKGEL